MATSDALRKSLQTAFATGDLLRICEAIDRSVVNFSSVTEVSKAAQIDRTTLYRAFRIKKGPALQTMIRVLHVLGFRLAVEVKKDSKNNANATRTARAISKALKIGNMELLSQALAITACEQENVTAFAKEAHMSREWVYRLFAGTRLLRFGTLLSYLNALGGLRFSIVPIGKTSKRR